MDRGEYHPTWAAVNPLTFILEGGNSVKKVVSVRKSLWFSLPVLIMGLTLVLGCGTSSAPLEAVNESKAAAPLTSVGIQVGDRITPFTLRLVDGTTLTSGDLLSRNRPTFLFFFKKG